MRLSGMVTVVGASVCVSACGLPPHAKDLRADQTAELADSLGPKADAELELLNSLLPQAIPLVNASGEQIPNNAELLQDLAAAQRGLNGFLRDGRILALEEQYISEIYREGGAMASAEGAATKTDSDNYIVIVERSDGELAISAFSFLSHEWIHFEYGEHSKEMMDGLGSYYSYEDWSVAKAEGDAPYIVTTVCKLAENFFPTSVESEMNRIDREIAYAIENRNSGDMHMTDDEIAAETVQDEYARTEQWTTMAEWATSQADTYYNSTGTEPGTIGWTYRQLDITQPELETSLLESPKFFAYQQQRDEELREALHEQYAQYFENTESTETTTESTTAETAQEAAADEQPTKETNRHRFKLR